MGRKVHPYGFRLGTSRTWNAKWYADKNYTTLLKEDITIRQLVSRRLANASVSLVDIERGINHVTVTVHTAKPGIVIGKGGANVEALRQQIGRTTSSRVKLEIKEIRQPELDAVLVASNIAQQLSRRIEQPSALRAIDLIRSGPELLSANLDGHVRIRHQIVIPGRIARCATSGSDNYYSSAVARITHRPHQRLPRFSSGHRKQQNGPLLERTTYPALVGTKLLDDGLI